MRRWLATLGYVGLVALVLTGCGRPAGVDGALVDDWSPLTEPTPFTPPGGVCVGGDFNRTAYLSSFNPIDCAVSHVVEIVHVGRFRGAALERMTPPPQGSPELRTAFAECDRKASEYVGGEWRTARLWLGVSLPSPAAWTGGSRWFRCDLNEVNNVEDGGAVTSRTSSLRGALRGSSPLRLGCYAATFEQVEWRQAMPVAECGEEHDSEFVGVWQAPDIPYPSKESDWDRFHAECYRVIAKYVGVPADRNIRARTGVLALPNDRDDWAAGNRGVRCYLWIPNGKMTKSLKGAGSAGLPIQYR